MNLSYFTMLMLVDVSRKVLLLSYFQMQRLVS
jgi:hypothetical protein